MDNRTKDSARTYICWDAASNRGCDRQDCSLSHQKLEFSRADYTVQMQILKRGGPAGPKDLSQTKATADIPKVRDQQQEKTDQFVTSRLCLAD